MSDPTFGLDPIPESVQAYVNERLPGATVRRRPSEVGVGLEEFALGLRLGARGSIADLQMFRDPDGVAVEFVARMVRDLERRGMETFHVAIAERTAALESRLALQTQRAEVAESRLADAERTIRALVGEAS